MANKYLSKIVKKGETIYIKDEEARAAINEIDVGSTATVDTCMSIIGELV